MKQVKALFAAVGALCVLATLGGSIATAQSEAPPGTCTGCSLILAYDENGDPCHRWICTGPGWPDCQSQTPNPNRKVCQPNETYTAHSCATDRAMQCTYQCNASQTGWEEKGCTTTTVSNQGGSYCDFSASACGGPSASGVLLGKPVRVSLVCKDGVAGESIVAGACGEGGCMRTGQCIPGRPCLTSTPRAGTPTPGAGTPTPGPGTATPVPGGTPTSPGTCPDKPSDTMTPPTCTMQGSKLVCDWARTLRMEGDLPCPNVVRSPFPRAIVGRPVSFQISGYAASDPGAQACICPKLPGEYEPSAEDPHSGCHEGGRSVFAVRSGINWMSADPFWNGANWNMDERAWNVDRVSDNGMYIASSRSGGRIAHTYETSSLDKLANGPSGGVERQPAYQVTLQTQWTAVAWFESQTREEKCYGVPSWNWDNRHIPGTDISPRWMGCGGAVNVEKREVSYPWRRDHTLTFRNLTQNGARVGQDPALANQCTVIPVPVIQSQSVLVK